jgi:hypothetical protein
MRPASRMFILVVLALTAMVMTAGAASAQEEAVSVLNEDTGVACNNSTGNCEHHVVGSSVLTQHIFGSESQASACNDEFVATLGPTGIGSINLYTNNAPNAPCTRINCNGTGEPAAESSWPVTNTGEYTNPGVTIDGHLTVRFCLDTASNPGGAGTHCTVEINVDEHSTNHIYGFSAVNKHCPIFPGIEAELDGSWESETLKSGSEDDIEIVHTPPIN